MFSYRKPSAFIIHGRNLNISDLPESNPDQLKILMLMESPNYAGTALAQLPGNYFNATISYRKSSRYFHPYGHFEPITAHSSPEEIITAEQVQQGVKVKSQGSLIFISHCETPSNRGAIIQALSRFTNITVKGACGELWKEKYGAKAAFQVASKNESDDELIASHRFYLAFENGICKDYVTEKFFLRISQLMVPVVLRRKILEDVGLPSDSFIAVDDFKSMEQLGAYLNNLRIDDDAYLRYFEWTKRFAKPVMWRSNTLCAICKNIYEKTKITEENIARFYRTEECYQ
ncbi:hypothetical protein Aduo_013216 [Ancylostoma duodenale]